MMGVRTPETCWAVHKRQVINLRNCCIQLVDLRRLSTINQSSQSHQNKQLHAADRIIHERPLVPSQTNKFPELYVTVNLINVFITAIRISLPQATCIHSTSNHPTSSKPILILSLSAVIIILHECSSNASTTTAGSDFREHYQML
jgi:hypothetical protein